QSMDNDYFKERAVDVKDVRQRVLVHLLGLPYRDPSEIDQEVVVIAHDLTPSDTAQLNRKFVKGFVTNVGGRTSHSAIMARSLEIPAVVGTKNVLESVQNGDTIVLDGFSGEVFLNPAKEVIEKFTQKQKDFEEKKRLWATLRDKPSMSKDNVHVELAANIGSPDDLESVLKNGAEGIGLYRTEFLYMNNSALPTEHEQYEAYKAVLEAMKDKRVVIRTLDIGGDKKLPYLPIPKEDNPFLGYRALRLCLEEKEIFKTQLRALLRASVHGNLHIMFPMVATLAELRDAKLLLEESKEELYREGVEFSDVKVGIMIEIPAAAILADQFAKQVDFFSIGTNDLIQYSFAADRMNPKVAYLYQPYNPSLLRLVKMVIDASHKEGIWTGMCGEMAGDRIASPILLGLGLDEYSMSASSILPTRELFAKIKQSDMKKMAEACLQMSSNEEVEAFVKKTLQGV
ncbi:MAG: phosphoenolpyruvate--protein phosphotransferase, partial [Candidatus Izemoplasmatales bacterium]|nr:phosphoenolpyruvate--protein phosphotransferase [Candidatus Izemoplasmatales bacterium]